MQTLNLMLTFGLLIIGILSFKIKNNRHQLWTATVIFKVN
ncbi:putative holin-like toxin [Paucilactobacillus hokkaidonensis]